MDFLAHASVIAISLTSFGVEGDDDAVTPGFSTLALAVLCALASALKIEEIIINKKNISTKKDGRRITTIKREASRAEQNPKIEINIIENSALENKVENIERIENVSSKKNASID